MATDPTILAVREMIGLVKQNIEFTLKKDRFLHCLKPKKPFGSHVKKSANSRTAVVRWSGSEWLFRASIGQFDFSAGRARSVSIAVTAQNWMPLPGRKTYYHSSCNGNDALKSQVAGQTYLLLALIKLCRKSSRLRHVLSLPCNQIVEVVAER